MNKLGSIDELINEIKKDKTTTNISTKRYPIRFIFLPDIWKLKELIFSLKYEGVKLLELENYLPHDDGFLTVDQVMGIVNNLDNNDYILVPFSELIRFYSKEDFSSILLSVAEIENYSDIYSNRRIYIPLVGIYERFRASFTDRFSRIANKVWAPMWELDDIPEKIKVYISEMSFGKSKLPIIKNTKQWLSLWKRDNERVFICESKTLLYLYENTLPDKVFDIEKVDLKELLDKVYGLKVPIQYNVEDNKMWQSLCEKFNTTTKELVSFDDFIRDFFNRVTITYDDIVKLWHEKDDIFSRWLLNNYIQCDNTLSKTYIGLVLKECIVNYSDSELVEGLLFKVFSIDINDKIIEERKRHIEHFYNNFNIDLSTVESKLLDKLMSMDNHLNALKYITGISKAEKGYLVKLSKHFKGNERQFLSVLEDKYPQLYYYLNDTCDYQIMGASNNWVAEYFNEYRWSKVRNSKSEKINLILNEVSKNKAAFHEWYYSFKNSHSLLKEIVGSEDIIWIDGLGVEWLPFIINFFREYGFAIEKGKVGIAYLPSNTDCNRFMNAIHVQELDKFNHKKEGYKYPDDLVDQIEIISGILEAHARNKESFILVSDHGFTALGTKAHGNIKTYNFKEASHEGRYMWTTENYCDDDYFIIHEPENKKCSPKDYKCVIAIKHSSLNDVPRREAHGGGTPEEVLVPILKISKCKGEIDDAIYSISQTKYIISKLDPVIRITINPYPKSIPQLEYKQEKIVLTYDKDVKSWHANMQNFKPGKYNCFLVIDKFKMAIRVEITGGMKERDLFE